ncbi:peroxynitrite isomerase THAP4-like [Amphiura filiformis]|uniref:peroxynitrite isomerase THAP4-like n=1 Tax=Amphiura filiformis TaxID=82378 RepID=UPI003B220DCF
MANNTDNVKSIAWLIGKWESTEATASFPSMQPMPYKEELVFTHVGQPMLNFSFHAWNPQTGKPLHKESGFLRVKPGTNEVAFMCAQNLGIVEIEEGSLNEEHSQVDLESRAIGRMSFATEPHTTKISRKFKLLKGDTLEQTVFMSTTKHHELTPHLYAVYKKINE